MSLLPAEKVKLDNYRAQYNSILGNISIANKELEAALSAAEMAIEEANNLRLTISNKRGELDEIRIENVRILKEQSNKENVLNEREDKVFKKECEVNERLHDVQLQEDIVDEITQNKIFKRNTLLRELDKSISEKTEKSLGLEEGCRQTVETLTEKKEEVQALTNLSESIKSDLSETMETHDTKLEKAQLKLTKVLKTIEEESIRVGVPSAKLDAREKALIIREADAKVIVKRLTKLYEEFYPDRVLKI